MAKKLPLLQRCRIDLAAVGVAGQIAHLPGEAIFPPLEFSGDEVEAVDDAPSNVGSERLQSRAREEVEYSGNDAPAFGLGCERLGHLRTAEQYSATLAAG